MKLVRSLLTSAAFTQLLLCRPASAGDSVVVAQATTQLPLQLLLLLPETVVVAVTLL